MNNLNCPLCAKQISSSIFNDDFSFKYHKDKNDINHETDVWVNNEIISNILFYIDYQMVMYYLNINYKRGYFEYSKNIPKKLSRLPIESLNTNLLIEDIIYIDTLTTFQ